MTIMLMTKATIMMMTMVMMTTTATITMVMLTIMMKMLYYLMENSNLRRGNIQDTSRRFLSFANGMN